MVRSTELIVVPCVLGREGVGMGAGPLALAADVEELLAPRAVPRIALGVRFGNEAAVREVVAATSVEAVTISAYDPAHDDPGGVRAALREARAAVRS